VSNFLCSIPFIPLIVVVRLIRPLLWIRFGRLINQRLGHFSGNVELYLCGREKGLQPGPAIDIFSNEDKRYCNDQLRAMWERTGSLRIWPWTYYMFEANKYIPGRRAHTIRMSDRDIHGLYESTPSHLSFTPEEEQKGLEALKRMGIPEDAQFVCFHTRDEAYLESLFPHVDWSYHNYRDSDIDDFLPAIEELTRRGYYVLRMGAKVKKPLITNNPRIVDYATRFRTDFLDIFLGAKCRFYFGDSCGLNAVCFIFRRPVATTNFLPLEYMITWGKENISIPKKLWLRSEKRYMAFREILDSGAGKFYMTRQYEALGVEIVNNSPEDITALAVEMDERLKGVWKPGMEDADLQSRFWSMFGESELNKVFNARIGADYLRRNRDLMN
jgi:putative glycosyltransferase (TIGR04372 family)